MIGDISIPVDYVRWHLKYIVFTYYVQSISQARIVSCRWIFTDINMSRLVTATLATKCEDMYDV